MKEVWIMSLIILAVVALSFAGCATATPSQAGVTELRLASAYPPGSSPAKLEEEYAQKVNEVTGGKVKITIYPSSTLLGEKDIITGINSGIADIGEIVITMLADQFPLANIISYPFLPFGSTKNCATIWGKLEDKFPEMKTEFKDFKVLINRVHGNVSLHTTKKAVRIPEDLKGLNIMMSASMIPAFTAYGASPASFEALDWYNALDRGIMDGVFVVANGPVELQFYKLTPYHTFWPSGACFANASLVMNPKVWGKLPQDARKKIDDLTPWTIDKMAQLGDDAAAGAIELMKNEGQTMIMLTPEEEQKWSDAMTKSRNEYLDKLEAKGLPAKEIYEEILKLTK